MDNINLALIQILELYWRLDVANINPICIYYALKDHLETAFSKGGFFQDFNDDNTLALNSNIKFCHPHHLTIEGNELTIKDLIPLGTDLLQICPGVKS